MNNNSIGIPRKLTKEDKEQITAAFLEMYAGLVRTNLGQDKTLGQSMYNAMEHEKMYVQSKKSNDAATVYLRQIQAFYAVSQSQQSMTDPNRDKKRQFANDNERNEFKHGAEQKILHGMKSIDEIIAEFQKDMEKAQQNSQQAEPIIKTTAENRDKLSQGLADIPAAQHHGPQMPANQLASSQQLPTQNMHQAEDYGAAKPHTASFQNGTALIQHRAREFENIKKLQLALIKQMQYQKAA